MKDVACVYPGERPFPAPLAAATRLPILTGETCSFPRNAPFPDRAGKRARMPGTFPAWAEFFCRGWLAAPRVLGGPLAGAASWLKRRLRREKGNAGLRRAARLTARFGWSSLVLFLVFTSENHEIYLKNTLSFCFGMVCIEHGRHHACRTVKLKRPGRT